MRNSSCGEKKTGITKSMTWGCCSRKHLLQAEKEMVLGLTANHFFYHTAAAEINIPCFRNSCTKVVKELDEPDDDAVAAK